jgi:nicotinamide-nucleotide amidase
VTLGAATALVARLRSRRQTVAVAESLTGGLLAAAFVDVPGASSVFRGGLVVYATDLKASLAGVRQTLLDERGPVDPDVAAALATGARRRCQADWGLATTGVAGPEPQGGQPVGRLYVAVAGDGVERCAVRRLDGAGDRPTIRRFAVEAALALFVDVLDAADATT